ncbi:MAG: Crp/Fnr family transcriptional regulator [Bacteroidota bacterium]
MTAKASNASIKREFANYLHQFVPLSFPVEKAILQVSEPYTAKKGELLLTDQQTPEHIYYMHTGAVHLYFERDGKRVTTWIALDESMISTIDNFTKPDIIRENVECIEDCEMLRISLADLHELYDRFHEVERLGRRLLTHYFGILNRKMHQNYFLTAKERYDKLLLDNPEIGFRVPLGVIASYLGITQETLSRIRRPDYKR